MFVKKITELLFLQLRNLSHFQYYGTGVASGSVGGGVGWS